MSTVGLLVPGVGMGGSPAGVAPPPEAPPTGAQSLVFLDPADDSEIISFTPLGAPGGLDVLYASGSNLPGPGNVRIGQQAQRAQWRAPFAESFGGPAYVDTAGVHILVDAEDENAWVRVLSHPDFLFQTDAAEVLLAEVWNNAAADADVDEFDAASGVVQEYTIKMRNDGITTLYGVRAFLDPAVNSYIEISNNAALGPWTKPTDYESSTVTFPDMAPGDVRELSVRRTIPAAAPYDPAVLAHFRVGYQTI